MRLTKLSVAFRPLLLACVMATPLSACVLPDFISFAPQVRGNKIDEGQLKELVPGISTRADVTSLIGSPTARASFDDNVWFYISSVTKPIIGGTLDVEHQQVIVMNFDDKGLLTKVEKKSGSDAMPVTVVSRTTPSPGSELTFVQQLLGNVGKFNPVSGSGASSSLGTSNGLSTNLNN